MNPRTSLTPEIAAKALASWWELAGLEPLDIDALAKAAAKHPRTASPAAASAQPLAKPSTLARIAVSVRKPADILADAQAIAAACTSLDALQKAMEGFDGCGLKANARTTVFGAGASGAPIMVIGETPGKEEDESGVPFVGPAGQLLDKMLSSIGLSRDTNCYLTNIIPWRPPGNRAPTQEEVSICRPFIVRHIELAAPKAILFLGGLSAQTILENADGIMKLRAKPHRFGPSIPARCTLHPAHLLNRPSEKGLAWKDLLTFRDEISVLEPFSISSKQETE